MKTIEEHDLVRFNLEIQLHVPDATYIVAKGGFIRADDFKMKLVPHVYRVGDAFNI